MKDATIVGREPTQKAIMNKTIRMVFALCMGNLTAIPIGERMQSII